MSQSAATGSVCYYLAFSRLPLSDLSTIRYTQVIWTAVLAFLIYRERITLSIIIACILTLAGVTCVAQPSFLFTKLRDMNETLPISLSENSDKRLLGMLFALLCAVLLSASIILTKKLFEKKVCHSIIIFHFILTTSIFLIIHQIYYWAFSGINHQKFDINNYLTKKFMYATILATLQC